MVLYNELIMINKKVLLVSIMCVGTLMASDDNIVLDGVQKRVCSKILGVDDEQKSNLTNKNNSICNKNVQNSTQTVHYESMQDKIEDKTPKIQELGKKFDISCSKEYSSTELTKLDVNRKLRIICMEMEYVCIKNFDSAIENFEKTLILQAGKKNLPVMQDLAECHDLPTHPLNNRQDHFQTAIQWFRY